MLGKIIRFEMWARLKQPITLLFFLMLVFQGIWFTVGNYDYFSNDNTYMNGAALFYKQFAGVGILLIIVVAIVTGTVLHKDIQYKSAGIFYSLPINEKQFFLGRFLSALLINVMISVGIFVGMLLTPYAGIGTPDKFGAMPWGPMFHGFLILTVSNLLMMTMVSFSMLVFFKKMAAGYLGIFALVMVFLVSESTSHNANNLLAYELIDPFAYIYTAHQMDTLPSNAKNYSYLVLNSTFLLNRSIWLGGTFVLFLLAYRRFSFKYFIVTKSKGKKTLFDRIEENKRIKVNMPAVKQIFSTGEFLRKLWRLSVLELRNVIRPVNFKIIMGILALMFFLQNIMWNATFYLGPTQPLTSTMTYVRLTSGFYIMIILMIWAGELFFRDKTVNIWQIKDALPVPVWISQLSKFVAMSVVALIMALVILSCGILAQMLQGGWQEIDLVQYADDLLGYKWGWITFIMYIALVFFVAGLTGNRFLTHVLCVGYYLFNIISFDMGIMEEVRFGFGLVPGVEDFSEMNGYGIFGVASGWYFLTWLVFTIVLILLGIHFWKRGTSLNFMKKLTFQTNQLNLSAKGMVLLSLIAFFFLQSFIVKQVNENGNFQTERMEKLDDANYEKRYKWIESKPQPKLSGIDLNVDLFPELRKADYRATMQFTNMTNDKVDSLYLYHDDFIEFEEIKWNGRPVVTTWHDEAFGQLVLPISMDTAETGVLSVKGIKKYVGFSQSDAQEDLAFNGLFINVKDLVPNIGYNADRELDKNRDRKNHELPKIPSRMAFLDDEKALTENTFAPNAVNLSGTFIVSTSAEQQPVMPGKTIKSWSENGRNYTEFKINTPSPFDWHIASGDYESHTFETSQVDAAILYKKEHYYNVGLYEKASSVAISFVNEKLGLYPHAELRIIEIPFYHEELHAYPNVIAIPEVDGWYADTTGLSERAYITFSVASQVISQWLFQNIQIANVQGADMLREALPGALALEVVKSMLGNEAVDGLLEKKKNFYGKERGNEPNQEPPLIYADGMAYLEANKGTIALYALSKKLGSDQFMAALNKWIAMNDGSLVHFKSLYDGLFEQVALQGRPQVKKDFEMVL